MNQGKFLTRIVLAVVLAVVLLFCGWIGVRHKNEEERQKTGAPSAPAEEAPLRYFTIERPLSPGEVTSAVVIKKHEFKRSQNDFEAKRYDEYKKVHGTLLVEQDSDAYGQVVATEVVAGEPLVKTCLLGPAREISLAVKTKYVWFWPKGGRSAEHWIVGEEVVGDYLRQALLCQVLPHETAPIVAAMGTVRPQVHLDEKEAEFIIEVEGSYGFKPEALACELRGRLYRRADSLVVGQAAVRFPAPSRPKGGSAAEGSILITMLRKASLQLVEELGGRFDSIPTPPAAEKAEEEKPAGGTAAAPLPKPSRSRGWLWGAILGGLITLVGERVIIKVLAKKRPTAGQQGSGP